MNTAFGFSASSISLKYLSWNPCLLTIVVEYTYHRIWVTFWCIGEAGFVEAFAKQAARGALDTATVTIAAFLVSTQSAAIAVPVCS
jgi:hypothetical protein